MTIRSDITVALPVPFARRLEKDGKSSTTTGDSVSGLVTGQLDARLQRIADREPIVPPMLDGQTDLLYAFSYRRLLSSYDGPLFRVQRSSDSTELDISADSRGELDQSTLLDFVGSGDGYVVTWYDQYSSYDMTASVPLVKIVDSGNLVTVSGRPCPEINSVYPFDASGLPLGFQSILAASVASVGTGTGGYLYVITKSGVGTGFALRRETTSTFLVFNHTGVGTNSWNPEWSSGSDPARVFYYSSKSISGSQQIYVDGNSIATNSADTRVSASFSQNDGVGKVREFVAWSSDKRSEVADFEANMQQFYG